MFRGGGELVLFGGSGKCKCSERLFKKFLLYFFFWGGVANFFLGGGVSPPKTASRKPWTLSSTI